MIRVQMQLIAVLSFIDVHGDEVNIDKFLSNGDLKQVAVARIEPIHAFISRRLQNLASLNAAGYLWKSCNDANLCI